MVKKATTLILFLFFPLTVFAYLDPGSGSLLAYFIGGIIATILFSLKEYFYKLLSLISSGKINHSLINISSADILFYSEGKQYWHVFEPVISALNNENISCIYYTSDPNDLGLKSNFKNCSTQYIGDFNQSILLLNRINVPLVVMTTPQLDVLQLKKSKRVHQYIHLMHSIADVLNYNPYAFDYFDVVMCTGPYQIKRLKQLEEIRKTPKKILLETGLSYFNNAVVRSTNSRKLNHKKTVLIAPTWGENNLLIKSGAILLPLLLKHGFQIILRPHPQSFVSESIFLNGFLDDLKQYQNISIDRDSDAKQSMFKADIIISDLSAIIYDFAFMYEKPVIVFKSFLEPKRQSEIEDIKNFTQRDETIWELKTLDKVATVVTHDNLNILPEVVESILKNPPLKQTLKLKNESVFNYGSAGIVAADQLIELKNRLSQ